MKGVVLAFPTSKLGILSNYVRLNTTRTYRGEVQGDVILCLGTGIKQLYSVWERNPSAAGTACKEIAERDRRRRSTMYLKVYAFLDVHCKSRATKSVNIKAS